MSDAKHTPGELWWDEVNARIRSVTGRDTGGLGIALARAVRGEMGPTEYEANARRLVACWNACQGLSTEALEGGLIQRALAALQDFGDLPDGARVASPAKLEGR